MMTVEQTRELVNAALADDAVDLSVPLMFSLALNEGLRSSVLPTLSRGDYHPAVGDVPGSLTYLDGDQVHVVTLSPQSELLLAAYLSL